MLEAFADKILYLQIYHKLYLTEKLRYATWRRENNFQLISNKTFTNYLPLKNHRYITTHHSRLSKALHITVAHVAILT